jgi:hypothetical protein
MCRPRHRSLSKLMKACLLNGDQSLRPSSRRKNRRNHPPQGDTSIPVWHSL